MVGILVKITEVKLFKQCIPGRFFSMAKSLEKNHSQLSRVPAVAYPPRQFIHSPQSQSLVSQPHKGSPLFLKCSQFGKENDTIVATVVIKTHTIAVINTLLAIFGK